MLRTALALLLGSVLESAGETPVQEGTSKPLFNGRDLTGWDTYLGPPKRGEPPLGENRDPQGVFSVTQEDGTPAIRISGETYGGLITREEFENYHLRVEFKWGRKRYPPRENELRDSGILYHSVGPHGAEYKCWMKSFEFQVMEGNTGDFWGLVGSLVDVEAEAFPGPDKKPLLRYKRGAPVFSAGHYPSGRRAIKDADYERPLGEWNVLELLCVGQTSIHVVNGKVCMVLSNLRQTVDGKEVPLVRGKIQLQSEGAEIFWRNLGLRPLKEIPRKFLE